MLKYNGIWDECADFPNYQDEAFNIKRKRNGQNYQN